MQEFYENQVFMDSYPSEAADFCNASPRENKLAIKPIDPIIKDDLEIPRFQIVNVTEELDALDAEYEAEKQAEEEKANIPLLAIAEVAEGVEANRAISDERITNIELAIADLAEALLQ